MRKVYQIASVISFLCIPASLALWVWIPGMWKIAIFSALCFFGALVVASAQQVRESLPHRNGSKGIKNTLDPYSYDDFPDNGIITGEGFCMPKGLIESSGEPYIRFRIPADEDDCFDIAGNDVEVNSFHRKLITSRLQHAVQTENYELAAKLRDELKRLEQ